MRAARAMRQSMTNMMISVVTGTVTDAAMSGIACESPSSSCSTSSWNTFFTSPLLRAWARASGIRARRSASARRMSASAR